ncbi:hypothetical protein RHIZ404_190262 [Rhizobium sp. EC-SD404]|nr:hypothetical protein RHIZ404_190262 [Rhizobium sp. EC-SD404]
MAKVPTEVAETTASNFERADRRLSFGDTVAPSRGLDDLGKCVVLHRFEQESNATGLGWTRRKASFRRVHRLADS